MNELLARNDPNPVQLTGQALAPGPFVLLGDHAGRAIPVSLDGLGLSAAERARHIAVDIGAYELGAALAQRLAAPFLHQAYSRLVIDCNRDPADATAIAQVSDHTPVPGNRGLDAAQRRARVDEVFAPYHAAIAAALDARETAGLTTILVSVHSFTPVMDGFARPWEIGVLHDRREDGFARAVLKGLQGDGGFIAADNEPYALDETDYTIPRHAFARALPYLEIEVRQDLIGAGGESRLAELTDLLGRVFTQSAR